MLTEWGHSPVTGTVQKSSQLTKLKGVVRLAVLELIM